MREPGIQQSREAGHCIILLAQENGRWKVGDYHRCPILTVHSPAASGRKTTISYVRTREVTMVGRQEDMAHFFLPILAQNTHTHISHLALNQIIQNEASLSAATAALPRSHSTDGHHMPEPPLRALSRPAFQGWDSGGFRRGGVVGGRKMATCGRHSGFCLPLSCFDKPNELKCSE